MTLAVGSALNRSGVGLRRMISMLAVAATALFASACETTAPTTDTAKPGDIGLYELRVYTATDGKMDLLDARFREHTIPLFKRHGMTPVAFFHAVSPAGGPVDNRLFYIMGYKDRAARDASWAAFASDPDWKAAYAASQADGSLTTKIENTFMTATDYSPPLSIKAAAKPRLFELRTYTTNPGRLEALHSRFRDHTLSIFKKHGMTSVIYWRPESGQPGMENKMVYLLAFPDEAALTARWAAFGADPEWKKVAADSQKDGTILISPGGVVSIKLQPTDYSPLK
jgi:hypothetical protein